MKCFRRDGRIQRWDAEVWSLTPPFQFWVSHGFFLSVKAAQTDVPALGWLYHVWFWGWQGVSKFSARFYSLACA